VSTPRTTLTIQRKSNLSSHCGLCPSLLCSTSYGPKLQTDVSSANNWHPSLFSIAAMCLRFAFSCKVRNLPVPFHYAFDPSSPYLTAQLDSTYDTSRGYNMNNLNVYRSKYESAALTGSTREVAAQCLYSNKYTKRKLVHLYFSKCYSQRSKTENST
jgi:hypothetical protein